MDFIEQLQQMKNGVVQGMLSKLPNMPSMPNKALSMFDENMVGKMEAMVGSMTLKERIFPDLINGSRKKRIAKGSARQSKMSLN